MEYNQELYDVSLNLLLLQERQLDISHEIEALKHIDELKKDVFNMLMQDFKNEYENQIFEKKHTISDNLCIRIPETEMEFKAIDELKRVDELESLTDDYGIVFTKAYNNSCEEYIVTWYYGTYFEDISKLEEKKLIKRVI